MILEAIALAAAVATASPAGPNVVLIMTDDQGYGDLGFHGNPVLQTPNLDAMAGRSARMQAFYVSPVCTPTRASLMTGRWCQRTGAIDTWISRAMMRPDEVTIAEMLRAAGWTTGIFGKWHLGDCYPMRAMDQGFDRSLVHRGGGIGQPADPEGGEGQYTDPVLFLDGERYEASGYCTDVYFDAALTWMREQHEAERPFFAYIATNAPHGPYHDVPEGLREHYAAVPLGHDQFPQEHGHPLPGTINTDVTARIFAMIENIDHNVGRLFEALEAMDALDDTLVIYLHDNGPQQRRYVAGMRGHKGEVYEGGVRSPLLLHWPARLSAGASSDRISAHVDVLPTILDACDVEIPEGVDIDGRSLLPLLAGQGTPWPDRPLVIQAHRGDAPVRWHNAMVRTQRWKLINASGFGRELDPGTTIEPNLELYDMAADPYELQNVADRHPAVVAELSIAYDRWFADVGGANPVRFTPSPIAIGAAAAPRVDLTRQDWRRGRGDRGWGAGGHWEVNVVNPGPFSMRVRFLKPAETPLTVSARIGGVTRNVELPVGAADHVFDGLVLETGPSRVEVMVDDGTRVSGAYQVIITKEAPAP